MAEPRIDAIEPTTSFGKWMDARLPLMRMMHAQFVDFPTPRNINYLWTSGGMLTFFLAVQIVTGIVLAMHYLPSAADAFNSVEHIRRDVNFGWLIRNMHAVGASMFFLAVYIHIGRGLYYGSYKAPREVLWIIGVVIFLLMMATAFMGYSLPWGQMSFWAVTVITNLFSSLDAIIPGLGTAHRAVAVGRLLGLGTTLNRFFSLHYLLPFVIVGARRPAHLGAARGRPEQPDRPRHQDSPRTRCRWPRIAVMKDAVRALRVRDAVRLVRVLPARLSRPRRQLHRGQPARRPRRTSCRSGTSCPTTRSCAPSPTSCCGVIAMFSSILLLLFVPWLDTCACARPSTGPSTSGSSGCSDHRRSRWAISAPSRRKASTCSGPASSRLYYFPHFLVVMPIVGVIRDAPAVPRSITEAVLGKAAAVPAGAAAAPEKR